MNSIIQYYLSYSLPEFYCFKCYVNSELSRMKQCLANSRCKLSKHSPRLKIVHDNMNRFQAVDGCKKHSLDGLY